MANNSSSSSSNAMAVVTGAAGQFVADMIKGPVDAFMGQIDALIHMESNKQLVRHNRDRLKNLSQDISNNFRDNENTAPSPFIQSYFGEDAQSHAKGGRYLKRHNSKPNSRIGRRNGEALK